MLVSTFELHLGSVFWYDFDLGLVFDFRFDFNVYFVDCSIHRPRVSGTDRKPVPVNFDFHCTQVTSNRGSINGRSHEESKVYATAGE